jgi:signal peptidase II
VAGRARPGRGRGGSPVPVRPPPLSAPSRRLGLVLPVAAGVLLLDQLAKTWALRELADEPIDLVWTLRLNLTFNTGAAFSQGEGLGPFIGVAAAAVVIGLLWSGRAVPNALGAVAMGMILGGAIGNLADRAFREGDGLLGGAVVDFIDFQWFPVFNVADIGVVGGALLLVLATALEGEHEDEPDVEPAPVDDGS